MLYKPTTQRRMLLAAMLPVAVVCMLAAFLSAAAARMAAPPIELRNALERALLLCREGAIQRSHLAFESVGQKQSQVEIDESLTLEQMEEQHIRRILQLEGGHVDRAARRLGVSRSSLYQKLKIYHIERQRVARC